MENTENMTTAHAQDVPYVEIHEVRTSIYQLMDDNKIDRDSPLVAAIFFLLDTLEAGKDVTITVTPPPTEYVLA